MSAQIFNPRNSFLAGPHYNRKWDLMCTHPGWTLHNSILAIMIMFEIKKKTEKELWTLKILNMSIVLWTTILIFAETGLCPMQEPVEKGHLDSQKKILSRVIRPLMVRNAVWEKNLESSIRSHFTPEWSNWLASFLFQTDFERWAAAGVSISSSSVNSFHGLGQMCPMTWKG